MSESTLRSEAPRRGALLPTIVIVGVALALLVIFARTWTDYLWYSNLNFRGVFTTQLAAQLGLFAVFGLLLGGALYASMAIAYRLRPKTRRANLDSELLIQLRDVLDRRSKIMMIIPAAVLGFIGGSVASGMYETFLAWTQSTPFGSQDAQFSLDASFYVFQLPWWRFVLGYVTFTVIVATIGALMVHFLTGSMTTKALRGLGNVDVRQSGNAAQRQLSIMVGAVLLLFATSAVLDRYNYLTTTNHLFTGVTYTDAASRIPAHLIVAAIAVICALLCFYNAYKVRWSIPAVSVALLVVSSMILSVVYPWFIQNFEVVPDEPDKERPYIAANIDATRKGFGIDDVQITDYEAKTTASAGQLKEDAAALPAIRLMDPAVIAPTFEQLQQVRGYYTFPATLDVDRYDIDGRETDAVVAVRELDLASVESGETWNNKRTVYTHGYGLTAAYGNQKEANGEPVFFAGGIPTVGLLPEHEPRIYFGEKSDHWVVAGAPKDRDPVELDTPGGGEGGGEAKFTYAGAGGVAIGDFLTKGMFAIRFGDVNLMLSDRVNGDSKILFNRVPVQRVQQAAPWLTVDSDPYPSVVDGKIVWIIDAYTTSENYPNSTKIDWANAISDTRTAADRLLMGRQVNYVRNSVKATVDAYDGTVKLYQWDESDPILQTWMKVYPGAVTDKSEISPSLLEHLRYPADLFKVQRETLGRYHTENTNTWYQQSDIWAVPNDPVRGADKVKEPPYFLTIRWPGDKKPHYANTTVFVPRERENLSVYMSANADASSEDYGQIRVLKLSDKRQIAGPGQTFNAISTDEQVAGALLPFNRDGSNASAIYGNLLTLPVGGGVLYVQPIYTQTKATTGGYPALRFVVVRFGEKVGIGPTLQAALDQVFEGNSGADTGEKPVPNEQLPGTTPPVNTPVDEQARGLLTEAMTLFQEADKALREGDLSTYQAKTNSAMQKAEAALKILNP
ncbi:UPF0182 family membrane protein [Tessaracoccus antarcticus]|uniref:UPF0182 protein EAX62_12315 n=1 Tax=Tessaracoccus antarcticus TaxID=2479848 RepID=A0A3M0GCN8_9ACTN|nr:UPF0182 family protein [Tessaracoccus antarcticus]RMB58889.1 UPF0182 family protein [Tessaracoccus antarcticus]